MVYNGTPRSERAGRARAALVRVGLGHRLGALPTRMSGGERQRVAIARALVHRPSLLLCDEPTGNLDTANAGLVLDLLTALNADGMTVLVITHDPDVAAHGTRTVTVRDGVLAEAEAEAEAEAGAGAGWPGPGPGAGPGVGVDANGEVGAGAAVVTDPTPTGRGGGVGG
ncbi:ATP-binding cassette domain-containing protein [Streptomyces ossamyceticus]